VPALAEDVTCSTGLIKFLSSAISSPHESADRRLIHERKVILCCNTFRGLTAGSAYITVRARHWNDCALGRRVSAPVMGGFRGTVLLDQFHVHYSELEVFLLIRHLATRCRLIVLILPSHDYLPSSMIAIFEKRVEHDASGTSGYVQCFHSANQIDACVYTVSRKHEGERLFV